MDYKQIIKQIEKKEFKPVYLLHGDEQFYIDEISDAINKVALEEHERDFNLSISYGLEADAGALIADAKSYPMMSERRLVILREAQSMKTIDQLESYFLNPTPTTIFVICHKHRVLKSNLKIYKAIAKVGLVFKAEKLRDYQIPPYITTLAREKGYPISDKASRMLSEFLGTDLSKINAELDKLSILIEKGSTINEIHVEENIGISKDYNMYELSNAIADRQVQKAFAIVDYFEKNPKSGDLVPIISSLFTLFSKMMRAHFLKGTDAENARAIRMPEFGYKKMKSQLKIYPPKKISANIAYLHDYDLKSKGVGNSSFTQSDLMRELVFKLMH